MDDLEEFESWHEDLMAWERTLQQSGGAIAGDYTTC